MKKLKHKLLKIILLSLTIILVPSSFTSAAVSWDLLDEDCSDISDWREQDYYPGISEVSPAGQFRFNGGTAYAVRWRVIDGYPDTFTVEIKLYHDAISAKADYGFFKLECDQADEFFISRFASDGLFLRDTSDRSPTFSGDTEVGTDLVKQGANAEWQTWRFLVTFTGITGDGTCDVYLDDSTHNWEKVGMAIPCSFVGAPASNGMTDLRQDGNDDFPNMETHVDYIKIAAGLYVPGEPVTYYVDTGGSNATGDGSQGDPWKTITYALTQVSSGDTIKINDGTYSENQINVPEGVSLTSTSQDNTKVIIQPATTHNTIRRYPLVLFESLIGVNNPSGQTLSYVTLDGDGVSNNGPYFVEAINIHDRDNVEIAHCIIKDFYKQTDFYGSNTVVAQSSKNEGSTQNWWDIWPSDSGFDGDDSGFDATWPGTAVEHVENFQFHDNVMRNCGNKIEDRSQANIGLWMVKDSQIYNNDINTAGCPGTQGITGTWPGSGPSACLWNVDFYNNNIKVDADSDFLGWATVGTIEIWLIRGGCEFYENTCNQGWSITRGKNTTIRDNIIIGNPHSYCGFVPDQSSTTHRLSWGFELDGQSYLDAHNNYLEGTSGGFKLGSKSRNRIVRTGRIYNNFIIDICGTPFTPAATKGSQVFDYKIYHNTADGRYSANVDGRGNFQCCCISVANRDAGSILEVDFENNIFTDARASNLGLGFCDGQGAYSNINVKNTLYDASSPNFWRDTDGGVACGTNIIDSIQDNPLYTKAGQNADYYKLQSSSPAINAGVSTAPIVIDDYWGTSRPQGLAYDIGAHEYDGVSCTESWTCTTWSAWSECISNQQSRTRICADQNNCGTIINKPAETETQSCESPAIYGITNFISLISDWLKTETGLESDVNNDGVVNTRDLGIMMSNWGE